jgi:hypothetical protein
LFKEQNERSGDWVEGGTVLDVAYGRIDNRWLFVFVSLLTIFIASGCCNLNQASSGVARIDESYFQAESQSSPDYILSREDEQITTEFTSCLRDNGLDAPDPELNSDGTIDFNGLRQSIASLATSLGESKTRDALGNCIPLLEGATFAQAPSPEDEIELQDNLLEFAQCLRDEGVDVPDPDFSNGVRQAMMGMFQSANMSRTDFQMYSTLCSEGTFGGRNVR